MSYEGNLSKKTLVLFWFETSLHYILIPVEPSHP